MKKLLILNRRDIRNPLAGGAEIYTHEIFRRLTGEFEITHFSSGFAGAERDELIDNIRYVRRGNEFTTHVFGLIYAVRTRRSYNLVIDQFNGIGFMTFAFRNSLLLIYQLYDDFWVAKFGRLGALLKPLEKMLLKLYRQKTVVTISDSTKKDLLSLGYDNERIHLVLNGLNYISYNKKDRFEPVVIFLGRLVKTKNPEDAIKVFLKARESLPSLSLYVVGEGEDRIDLTNKYKEVSGIKFFGFVSDNSKYALLREAAILLVPSIREGWGQVVTQANMTATPAIAYDVEGIRDSILDEKTGILVPRGDVNEMADKIVYLFANRHVLKEFSDNALEYARTFSWDESAEKMKKALLDF